MFLFWESNLFQQIEGNWLLECYFATIVNRWLIASNYILLLTWLRKMFYHAYLLRRPFEIHWQPMHLWVQNIYEPRPRGNNDNRLGVRLSSLYLKLLLTVPLSRNLGPTEPIPASLAAAFGACTRGSTEKSIMNHSTLALAAHCPSS